MRLCGEFIADVPVDVANRMLNEIEEKKRTIRECGKLLGVYQ
jgi:hypothetical protein